MSDWGLDPSLFGKVYSYEDLLHVQRPGRAAKPHTTLKERPANWPANVEVDTVSRWAFWLPEGWAQGINTTVSGKTLKCYMTPEGKRFFHKKDIEKFIGRVLPSWEPPQPKEGQEKAVKSVSDPDAIPHWPEEGWLPKEWFLAFRQLPSGLHRIYIPPGQREGFCYHRSTVMEYLSGENPRLSPFGTSMAMAEDSANAASTGARAAKRHKSSTLEAGLPG